MVAGAIAAAGILTGIGLFINILVSGTPKHTFTAGDTVTVHLQRDPRPGFFVSDAGSPTDSCYAQAPGGQRIMAEPISGSMTVSVNDKTWHVLSRLRLPADGTYQVSCLRTASNTGAEYGIGTPPTAGGFALVFLIPIASIGLAVLITIIVAVRRRSHRRRLAGRI